MTNPVIAPSDHRDTQHWSTVAAAVAVGAIYAYAMRRGDPDLWGYLDAGRLFWERGTVHVTDPFAFTSGATDWVTFEYLSDILLWLAYTVAGTLGLVLLKTVVGGLALYWLARCVHLAAGGRAVWLPVFLVAAALLNRSFLFRPQLFSFAFFAFFTLTLWRHLLQQRARLWLLPLVMLAWANLHGGFLAGLGAIGLAVALRGSQAVQAGRPAFEGTGPLVAVGVAATAASFVTPEGFRLWEYVVTEVFYGTNKAYIAEWLPLLRSGDTWSMLGHVMLSASIAALAALSPSRLASRRGPAAAAWAVSGVVLIGLGFSAVRHVPIAAIWLAPVAARLLTGDGCAAPRLVAGTTSGYWVVAVFGVIVNLTMVFTQLSPIVFTGGTVFGSTHPCGVAAFMRNEGLEGRLYTPLPWGSFFTWELYPRVMVSMDGRNITRFPKDLVLEHLRFYSDAAADADLEAPLRHDSDVLVLPTDSPVLERVRSDTRWQVIYADGHAVLFQRSGRARQQQAVHPRPVERSCDSLLDQHR